MVDLGTVTEYLPELGISGSLIFNVVTWLIIIILLVVIAAIITYFIIRKLKYNKKLIIFEKVDQRYAPTKKDKAMEIKFGESGDTLFYARKNKKYLPRGVIQTGKNTYWYVIREDGEWINIGMEDIDISMKQAKARYLDKEARYSRTQIQKGLKDRYDKPGFWQQYGLLIFSIGFLVVLGVMMWLLFDKWIELAAITNQGVDSAATVMERANQILSALDNLCSGGSGLVQQ